MVRQENIERAVSKLSELLEPGLLGQYTWFEAVELIAFVAAGKETKKTVRNIFSIYIAEQGEVPQAQESPFLDQKSKKLKGLDGWQFRVTKRPVLVAELVESLRQYGGSGRWAPPGQHALEVGKLVAKSAVFCPPDSRNEVPLNAVLKNNFWSGSYVIELADNNKLGLTRLVSEEELFGELTDWLTSMLPINLGRVPDRIGDVLIQVPANALSADFRRRPGKPLELCLGWNPAVPSRPLLAEYRIENDGIISCMARFDLGEGTWAAEIPYASGNLQFSVWDKENELILTALTTTAPGGNFRIDSRMSRQIEAPRRLKVTAPSGQTEIHEITLMEPSGGWQSHQQPPPPQDVDWQARRQLKERMKRLLATHQFMQYGLAGASQQAERERALGDLRNLIRTVSQGAIYLWDPYLSANDILNTLAFCTDAGTELWGLTSSKSTQLGHAEHDGEAREKAGNDSADASLREKWISEQKNILDDAFSTPACMKLEFRMSWGIHGGFHDRFLIFPGLGLNRTRAWSLGASINHIGGQHCIIQEVSYPEPLLKAFQHFWQQSAQPQHLIWKFS